MKATLSLLALVAIVVVGVAIAQEKGKTCTGGKCPLSGKSLAGAADCEGGCPLSAANSKLPKMTYQVGDKSVCCAESAAELAKESNEPVVYVVAKKTYEDKTEAYTALVEETETFVEAYVTPAKCSTSGKTSIAGKACGCPLEAGKRAELVKAAVAKVKMTYKVGEEEVCCSQMAASLAEKTGDTTCYLVNGETISCDLTARLKLAVAKYKAAVKAVSSGQNSTDAGNTEAAQSGT